MSWKHGITDANNREIAVLGPVTIDCTAVTRRQRALVSVLVLHQTQGASTESITDAIWGSRPPASARASIQNQVARLRATFGTELIATHNKRYHIDAATDVRQFEMLVAPRMDQPLVGDSIVALSAALDLWHGAPFEDISDYGPALVERTRLGHLRGLAVERLAVARLVREQFEEAIGELLTRTTDEPFHERAWELLIVAFYLSDRRTEALLAYSEFEVFVQSELAARPSMSIRRLRDSIALDQPIDWWSELDIPPEVASTVSLRNELATA